MAQAIDKAQLRAAAEHLDWVLSCYPDQEKVQNLRASFTPLIERAKSGLITEPQDRDDFPARWALAERVYADFESPSVEEALVAFSVELRGAPTDREKRLIAELETRWQTGDQA